MKKSLYFVLLFFCFGCLQNSVDEKHQHNRNNVLNVHDKIKQINSEEILIGPIAQLYVVGEYLLISDVMSFNKTLHLFNKNDFKYIISFGDRGQGPYEITHIGHIAFDRDKEIIFVADVGKQKIFKYQLDSLLMNSEYLPRESIKMPENQFLDNYTYINDSTWVGTIIEPIGNSDFKPVVAKWNFGSGNIEKMGYENPYIKKKRTTFAVSLINDIYLECYCYHDLITICSLNGELRYNIYGPNWSHEITNDILYFGNVVFCDNKILALYSGSKTFNENKTNYPTKFHIFDVEGEYIQTLETDFKISNFCYDEHNNRIIMSLDDEHFQFAYMELNDII